MCIGNVLELCDVMLCVGGGSGGGARRGVVGAGGTIGVDGGMTGVGLGDDEVRVGDAAGRMMLPDG